VEQQLPCPVSLSLSTELGVAELAEASVSLFFYLLPFHFLFIFLSYLLYFINLIPLALALNSSSPCIVVGWGGVLE
jgi:hypothetical protein